MDRDDVEMLIKLIGQCIGIVVAIRMKYMTYKALKKYLNS